LLIARSPVIEEFFSLRRLFPMGKLVLNPGQMPHHSLSGLDVILARDGNLFHGLEKSKPILHRLSQSLIAPLKQMPHVPPEQVLIFWRGHSPFFIFLKDLEKRFLELGLPFIPLHEKSRCHVHIFKESRTHVNTCLVKGFHRLL